MINSIIFSNTHSYSLTVKEANVFLKEGQIDIEELIFNSENFKY